jgi:uncharacterized protein YbjT (DUF2867 family)
MRDVAIANSDKLITVIGGSGFIGRHIVRSLAKRGYRVRVACRRPDLAGHLITLGGPGQIVPMQANIRYPASLAAACAGCFAIINLPAVLYNSGAQNFDALHIFGAEAVAKAAKSAKAQMLIQFSSIGADVNSTSAYARTKAAGEAKASSIFHGATIIRPSIVFGPEDNFYNQFAKMARFSPVLPLIGGGKTMFQPVFVGDVAEAVATLVDRGIADGKVYELGGPEKQSFKHILQYILATVQRKRLLLPLPFGIASLVGAVAGVLPKPFLTSDQVESLKTDNVVSTRAESDGRTLQGLGLTARSVASVVPSYLYRFRKAGQFTIVNDAPE